MNTHVFRIVIGFVVASVFSGTAFSQIQVQIGGGGNHYARNQRRTYDYPRQGVRGNYNHYQQNQYRNLDHAIKDVVTRGTTNPYGSPQHYNTDRWRQNNHYRADTYRSYDQYTRGRNTSPYHYQPRNYGH